MEHFNLIMEQKKQIMFIIMRRKIFFFAILCLLQLATLSAPISIDFNRFQASFSSDQKLKLLFRCSGGTGVYTFKFVNIPSDWKVVSNSIVIENYSLSIRKSWSFDIYVTDTKNNYLSQTLNLNFMGAYIGLTAVTLPTNGINTFSYYNYDDILSIANQLSRDYTGFINQPPKVDDLVSQYPGLDPFNRLTTGFGVPNQSPIAAELIASSKALYNPLRDSKISSPYKTEKQVATRKQGETNQTLSNLLDFFSKINSSIEKLNQEAQNAEKTANQSRLAVSDCDSRVIKLQDMKAKVKNAIIDKQSKLEQYNFEANKTSKAIDDEISKLAGLQEQKKKSEIETLPNSRALENLQKQLEDCKSNLMSSSKKIDQVQIDVEKLQSQIKIITIESNDAKNKLQKINGDLNGMRQKIRSLQAQLNEARTYESNILKEKQKYEDLEENNAKKLKLIQDQLKGFNIGKDSTSTDCKAYEAPIYNVQNLLNKDKDKYNHIIRQIADQKNTIDKLRVSLVESKRFANSLPFQIKTLKAQIDVYDTSINRTSYLCEDAIMKYSKAAVTFKNTQEKIDSTRVQLEKINRQISTARLEQQNATSILQNILKQQNQFFKNTSSPNSNQIPTQSLKNSSKSSGSINSTSTSSTNTKPPSSVSPATPIFNSTPSNNGGNYDTFYDNSLSVDDIVNKVVRQRNEKINNAVPNQPDSSFLDNPFSIGSFLNKPTSLESSLGNTANQTNSSQKTKAPSVDISQNSIGSLLNQQAISSNSEQKSNPQLRTGSIEQLLKSLPPSQITPVSPATSESDSLKSDKSQLSAEKLNNTRQQNVKMDSQAGQIMPVSSLSSIDKKETTSSIEKKTPLPLNLPPQPTKKIQQTIEKSQRIIGDQFKISSRTGFKSLKVDINQILKRMNINVGEKNKFPQNSFLYTIDQAYIKNLTPKENSMTQLSNFSCSAQATVSDEASIQDIGIGYILAKNSKNLYRLTLSECTKLTSTGRSNPLKLGTKVYFSGVTVVAFPFNVLVNANLVIFTP